MMQSAVRTGDLLCGRLLFGVRPPLFVANHARKFTTEATAPLTEAENKSADVQNSNQTAPASENTQKEEVLVKPSSFLGGSKSNKPPPTIKKERPPLTPNDLCEILVSKFHRSTHVDSVWKFLRNNDLHPQKVELVKKYSTQWMNAYVTLSNEEYAKALKISRLFFFKEKRTVNFMKSRRWLQAQKEKQEQQSQV